MIKKYKVAIVGGHGLVLKHIVSDLLKTQFPLESLTIYGSKENANVPLIIDDVEYPIHIIEEENIDSFDIVFFCSVEDLSYKYAEAFMSKGARIIDNSSYFRMYKSVPLVNYLINPQDLLQNSMIYALPNCTTNIMLLAIFPLHEHFVLEKIIASTYQSASGYGNKALNELAMEEKDKDYEPQILPSKLSKKKKLYDNVLPIVDNVDLKSSYTFEEIKMKNESIKIMHLKDLEVSCTCVRVPTTLGHAISASVVFKHKVDLMFVKKILNDCSWIKLLDDDDYPDLSIIRGESYIAVGRLRIDSFCPYTLHLFIAGDNLVAGASYNAVMVAHKLLEYHII